MAHANPWNLLSTVLLVTGALVFGEALHQSIVTGEVSLFSQSILLALALGTALIALGYRVRVPAEVLRNRRSKDGGSDATDAAALADASVDGAPADGAPADADYDPRMSPLGNTPSDARNRSFAENAQAEARRVDEENAGEQRSGGRGETSADGGDDDRN
ncbi:hypothetical protein [Haloprofundus salilacus]|uniref:hypothetical protein n=1 Tax=Haloprofundus salilacus TaxID=2876190 RepID=UPI001CCAA70E|nr:hypothetical protein [Haloprofundus salilacus]